MAYLVGGFNHLEKYSQWEGLSHIKWENKNVPNHQPEKIEKIGNSTSKT
jgi:hypothetical protein